MNVTTETEFLNITYAPLFNSNQLQIPIPTVSKMEQVLLLILSVLSFSTNATVCVVILSYHKLRRRVTNIYVVSFCITQLLVSGVLLPLFCFIRQNPAYDHLSALLIISYALHLTAVTYERLQAVNNSLRYNTVIVRSKAIKTIVVCWVISIAVQFLPFLWVGSTNAKLIHKIFLVLILVLFLLLPLIFICYTYIVIFTQITALLKRDKLRMPEVFADSRTSPAGRGSRQNNTGRSYSTTTKILNEVVAKLRSSRFLTPRLSEESSSQTTSPSCENVVRKMLRQRRSKIRVEAKTAVVFGVVSLSYALSWFPVIFMTFLDVLERKDIEPEILKNVSAILIGLNSLVDPIVYGVMLKDVRCHLKKSFSPIFKRKTKWNSTKSRHVETML